MSVPTHSGIAQLAEHLTVNQGVVGSSPTPGAKKTTRPTVGRFAFIGPFGSKAKTNGCGANPEVNRLITQVRDRSARKQNSQRFVEPN